MTMPIMVQKIDDLYLPGHYCLDSGDDCYFFLTYMAKKGYGFSSGNQLIYNLKKSINKKGTSEWQYKEKAIETAADFFAEASVDELFPGGIYVPVPPSKVKDCPEYDDRVVRILQKAYRGALDIRELVIQKQSTESFHTSRQKRSVDDIYNNLMIDESLAGDITGGDIVIFDDVLTSGAHFKAMSRLLRQRFGSDIRIHGLFVARTVWLNDDADENDL